MCVTDLAVSKPSKLNLEANEYYREREREGMGRKKNQKIRKKKERRGELFRGGGGAAGGRREGEG